MSFLPVYLDSSAILKFVFPEPESAALRKTLARWPDWITCQLSVVECHRAVRRAGGGPRELAAVERPLRACTVLLVDSALVRLAGSLAPPELRSLDAIHLAAALSLGAHPDAFVTYDVRMAAAARDAGLAVLTPGV